MNKIKCKCCNATANFVGNLDFNKSCHDRFGARVFDISPILIPYFSCENCGFTFTNHMDLWSNADFKEKIYNSEYGLADGIIPGYEAGIDDRRKTISYSNGMRIADLFSKSKEQIRVLDYGSGGNPGDTGLALIDNGFDLTSFEPHLSDNTTTLKHSQYDLIISIEVFEHCHNLSDLGSQMNRLLSRDGLIWIQTLLHPTPAQPNILDSWYIAPRNGHISIFTLPAITLLFRQHGINIVQNVFGIFGFKKLPLFSNNIFI